MQSPAVTEPAAKQVTYLDPTGHVYTEERQMSRRITEVRGSVAALLDNGNDTSNFFFRGLAKVLQEEFGVSKIIMETKFTSTKPADQEMINSMSEEADFMVAGVCL
jgi:hypothetical protein